MNNRDLATKLINRLKKLLDDAFDNGEYAQAKEYKRLLENVEMAVQVVKDNFKS